MPPYVTRWLATIQLANGEHEPAWWTPENRPVLHHTKADAEEEALDNRTHADGFCEDETIRECWVYPGGSIYVPSLGRTWRRADFLQMRGVTV